MTRVIDILNETDKFAPISSAEKWDNCGILAGDKNAPVTKIMTALDITKAVVKEAEETGAELIVSHHPVIFTPLRRIDPDLPAARLIRSGISAICVHTPFDMSARGMNSGLFEILGKPLGLKSGGVPLEDMGNGLAIGMIYDLEKPLSPEEAAGRAKAALGCKVVRFTAGREIKRLAVSSGSGNSFAQLAADKGADGLLSGDFKHDVFIDAVNNDFTLIDCGHFYTERIFAPIMRKLLSEKFPDIEILEAKSCTDPASYI